MATWPQTPSQHAKTAKTVTIKKGARITGAARDKLAADLRKKYEKGQSIRALAEGTGRSYGFVHRLLLDAEVPAARPRRRHPHEEEVTPCPIDPDDSDRRRSTNLLGRGHVVLRVDGPVATVSLDRPAARNAQLPRDLGGAGAHRVHAARRHPGGHGLRRGSVVLRGSGPVGVRARPRIAAGAPSPGAPRGVADEAIAGFQRGFSWLADPRFVSIAAVAGHAVGAGFQLALACDLIVVADDAQFRMAEVSYGLVPDLGGTGRLLRLVGYQRALEICATGRHVQCRRGRADRPRAGAACRSPNWTRRWPTWPRRWWSRRRRRCGRSRRCC